MFLIRPIQLSDYQAYVELAYTAKLGMLTMPKNPELLQQYLQNALLTFSDRPCNNPYYLFVLENTETKQIGGVCGIFASIGADAPKYYFSLEKQELTPYGSLPLAKQLHTLKPISISQGPSEICSLFLAPNVRKAGLGKLLSFSRFLFIANFPKRFTQEIYAEMRGFANEDNTNPFWDCIGRKFLNLHYPELIEREHQGMDFVPYVLPKHPIYVELLPKEAQEAIGKVHINTCPALKMLQEEGFAPCDLFDIFDAGPVIKAETQKIRTVANCQKALMEGATMHNIESPLYIVSNDRLDFRACLSPLQFSSPSTASLPISVAKGLNLQLGDSFTYIMN
jgi:arginine N-succinyltransferase